jgi:hypothetical protein
MRRSNGWRRGFEGSGARNRYLPYRVNAPEGVEPAAFGGGAPFDSVPTSPFGPEIPGGVEVAADGASGMPPAPAPAGMGSMPGMALPMPFPLPCAACAAAGNRHSRNKTIAILAIPALRILDGRSVRRGLHLQTEVGCGLRRSMEVWALLQAVTLGFRSASQASAMDEP